LVRWVGEGFFRRDERGLSEVVADCWVALQTADPGPARGVRVRDDRFEPRRALGDVVTRRGHNEDTTVGKKRHRRKKKEPIGRSARPGKAGSSLVVHLVFSGAYGGEK
jgi:hypothetical protein